MRGKFKQLWTRSTTVEGAVEPRPATEEPEFWRKYIKY